MLKIENLHKIYGKYHALSGLDMTVKEDDGDQDHDRAFTGRRGKRIDQRKRCSGRSGPVKVLYWICA